MSWRKLAWLKSFVFFFPVLFLIFGGCQRSEEAHKKEMRLMLDWLPNPNHVPIYAGIEKGFFAERGIDLQIYKAHDPSDALPYLLSGTTDLAVSYSSTALRALSRGADVQVVGILMREPLNSFIFREGEGIRSPHDFSGKIIGYCSDGSERHCLDMILEEQSLHPQDVRNINFDLVSMLATKHVDVVYEAYWNIEVEHLRSLGVAVDYFPVTSFSVPKYPELIFVSKKHSRVSHPAIVQSFQEALQESIDFSVQHPHEAFASYLKANPDKTRETQEWEWRSWLQTYPLLPTHQKFDETTWSDFYHWMRSHRLLSQDVDLGLMIADSP